MNVRHTLPLVLAVALGSALGCTTTVVQPGTTTVIDTSQTSGRAPIIASFDYSPKAAVSKNDFITFTLVANDLGGQPLQYNWTATRGRLTSNTGAAVAWQPMMADGTLDAGLATVTVIVSNGVQTTTGSVNIQINADGTATVSQPPVISQPSPGTPGSTPPTATPDSNVPTETPGSIPPTTPASPPSSTAPGTVPGSSQPGNGDATSPSLVSVVGQAQFQGEEPFYTSGTLAVDKDGNMYVTDGKTTSVKRIDASGKVTTYAGSGRKAYADGSANGSDLYLLDYANFAAMDDAGNLYIHTLIADVGYQGALRKINKAVSPEEVGFVTTFAKNTRGYSDFPIVDGLVSSMGLGRPTDLEVAKDGTIYLYDTESMSYGHGQGYIRKIGNDGNITTLAGGAKVTENVYPDGQGTSARLSISGRIALDANGNVLFVDGRANKIRKMDASGKVSTVAGSGSSGLTDGLASASRFNNPSDLVIDASGNILVADSGNSCIRKISTDGNVTTFIPPSSFSSLPRPDRPISLSLQGDTLYILNSRSIVKVKI